MFGNSNNNNFEKKDVNTKIKYFYGDSSLLQMAYWNDKISVSISPLKTITQDGLRQYDYQRKVNTAIAAEKAIALAENIKTSLIPAWESLQKGEDVQLPVATSVVTNSKGTTVTLSLEKETVPFFMMGISVKDGNGNSVVEVYKFTNTESTVVEGEKSKTVISPDEFKLFYSKLEDISEIFGTAAHNAKLSGTDKFDNGSSNSGGNFQQNSTKPNNYSADMSTFGTEEFPF